VRHASDHFIAPDGLRLATRSWLPRCDRLATVVLVHGFAEHVGRHDRLATALARCGYAVLGYDQRGHGYSPGERANVPRLEVLFDDLAAFAREARASDPGVPLVVLGHSLGGLVALRSVQEGLVAPDLMVLSSPLLRMSATPPRSIVRLLTALARPFPRLPTLSVDHRLISSDPQEAEAYRLDPAIYHGPAKARIATEMARHGELALAHASRVAAPTLLLHGKGDRLVDPGPTGHLARELPNASLRLYDGGAHELFHDTQAPRVTADVLAWLQARLSPDATLGAA
jgi:alpha-beta hydrolase superfamily lysophospholipase